MIILWIQRMKRDGQKKELNKDDESFQEHDDLMKRFRQAHPDLNVIGANDIVTADNNLLAPVQGVKLGEHIQN